MTRFTKKLLVGVVALGLLAPVATSTINPVSTNVSAKSRWHHGTPRTLRTHKYWIFNGKRHTRKSNPLHYPTMVWFFNKQTEMAYKHGTGLGEWWFPRYRYLGHHTYHVVAGDHGRNGDSYIVRKYGKHALIWLNHQYLGYFHESNHAFY